MASLIIKKSRPSQAPIAVFDSGVGGLTVLRALKARLPYEDFVYLGDTARLPYGTKSGDSIVRYSLQAARWLTRYHIKCLVVACNTASAVALDALRSQLAPLPIIGVVEPGAEAGCQASLLGRMAVIATDGTVRGGAYQRAIKARRPDAVTVSKACPLFVSLAEEGWTSGPIAEAVAHRYLDELFQGSHPPDTLILGCTHFPVLAEVVRKVVGNGVRIVDSASTTAAALSEILQANGTNRTQNANPTLRLFATDGPERFASVGAQFLGQPMLASEVELIDLQEVP